MPDTMKRLLTMVTFCVVVVACIAESARAQTVLTVREAEFRARWAGQPEDRLLVPQYFQPDGGLGEEEETTGVEDEAFGADFGETMDRMADNLSRGLRFGPLEFGLGLATGWEYSSQNSYGSGTDGRDNNSFFVAPTAFVRYEREIGVWSVAARAGTGYRYYFNQDYTAAGTGNQRNPLSFTGGLDVGYNTSRLSVNLNAAFSSGTGYDIVSGNTNLQTTISSGLSLRYIVTEAFSVGAAGSITFSDNADAQAAEGDPAQPDSNSLNAAASVFADYLVTPKTNVRLVLSAGQALQEFSGGGNEGRRYFDSMVVLTYQIAPKFSVDGGAGIGYVTDQNIPDPEFTGLRPIYTAGVRYTPTEKTYVKGSFSMQGTDIRPNFNVVAGWNVREKTRLSLSLYQNQGFSSLSPDQYNVTRGLLGTVSQRLFKGIDLSLSGGYERNEYVSLTSDSLSGERQGPSDYFLARASLYWRIREWLAWDNSFTFSSGQGNNNEPQTRISTSLNLSF
jgi:hypothetical protein